jgi:hypothetical protein
MKGEGLERSGVTAVSYWTLHVEALAGGHVLLTNLATVSGDTISVLADGSDSVVDLTGLVTGTSFTLEARNGSSIGLGSLIQMVGVNLIIRNTGTLTVTLLRSLTQSTVTIDGALASFPNLVDTTGTTFTYQNGGRVDPLPPNISPLVLNQIVTSRLLLPLHGTDRALLTLDASILVAGFWTSATPKGFNETVQFLGNGATPGVLQPGEIRCVPVYFAGLRQPWDFGDNRVDFNLTVLQAGATNVIDWAPFEQSLRPPTISPETWVPIWNNFLAQVGGTGGSYVSALADNAAYLGRLGLNVPDVSGLLAFELQQAAGIRIFSTLADAVDSRVTAPGLVLTFGRSFGMDIVQRYDIGPLGRGWDHNWQRSLVREADGTVKAFGQNVSVRGARTKR